MKRNRLLLLLALLMTAATGAWATDVYVVGNGDGNWLNDAAWDPGVAGNKMTEQNGVYSITFNDVDANSELLFKFAINGTWDVNYGCTSWDANELNKTLSNIEEFGNNIMFGLTEKADVTISFNLSELTYMISTKGMKVGDDAATTYTVSLKDGVKDADKWTITPNPAEEGQTVTLQYNGRLKVKGVKATSDAAPAANPIEVLTYSFDDASHPSGLTAGSRVSFDYSRTSVITNSKFLNAYNNTNGDPSATTLSLGDTDLSGETWTLSFEWAACGGCNSKPDHTTLKAGDATLFDLNGNSNWNTTVTIIYTGSDGSKTLPVPACDKSNRFTEAVGDQYNTTTYWHHIVVTGSAEGVKMTITNSSTGAAVVEDVVLSETNVNPTSLIIEPSCGGGIGIDALSLTYEPAAAPAANIVDLSKLTENTELKDGDVLTGTLGANVKISIADGATVTLDGVTINGANNNSYNWAGITCLGDATIILSGTNTVKGFYEEYPGIQAAADKTLTINGTGSLTASSNGYACGIGGGWQIACGNIVIAGGTITANGGSNSAGIGGGYNSSCGTISITGGTVNATGGLYAAGIGGGRKSSCGNISITGGTVNATSGNGGAGIGGGYQGSCGTVTITNGVTSVTANKSSIGDYSIGAGFNGTCGTVTIGGVEGAITTSPYTYQPSN